MLEKVKKTIKVNNMITTEDKILVALSGGCDSVCLSVALKKLGYSIGCAHLNHMIRDEAEEDQNFCKSFCEKNGFTFHTKNVNVPALAEKNKTGLENQGREERYKFFEELCKEYGYTKIAVAHNKNDNCETMLINLMRGSGLKGLCGILPVRDKIIRPLIECERSEIEEFVNETNESYVTDKTNFLNDYTRNKVRNVLIPGFLEINSNFVNSMSKTSALLREDFEYINKSAEKYVFVKENSAGVEIKKLINEENSVIARALMKAYEHIAKTSKDFEKKHIDYIIDSIKNGKTGKIIDLCFNVRCSIRYGKVIFEKKEEKKAYEYILEAGKSLYIKECDLTLSMNEVSSAEDIKFLPEQQYFTIDEGKVTVRSRKDGDYIIPYGHSRAKKVKKIFIDKKTDISKRDVIPIIEYNGSIIWVYGHVRSALNDIKKHSRKIYVIRGDKKI